MPSLNSVLTDGSYWIDNQAPGTLAHLVIGRLPSPPDAPAAPTLCGLVRAGLVSLAIDPSRACARCLDLRRDALAGPPQAHRRRA